MVVVNPRRVRLIAESTLKTDAIDAEILARLAGSDPALLQPVYQRRPEAEALRTRLGVRRSLRRTRVAMINSVRGTLWAHGYRGEAITRSSRGSGELPRHGHVERG